MGRMARTKQPEKPVRNFPQINIRVESRGSIDLIGHEWRMNIQETVAALIELWNNSTDEDRGRAIRRPVRETVTA